MGGPRDGKMLERPTPIAVVLRLEPKAANSVEPYLIGEYRHVGSWWVWHEGDRF